MTFVDFNTLALAMFSSNSEPYQDCSEDSQMLRVDQGRMLVLQCRLEMWQQLLFQWIVRQLYK